MSRTRLNDLKHLEGRHVSLALADGSRIDDCELVSSGRTRANSLWLFLNGQDTFIAHNDVVDLWELMAS